MLKIHPAAPDGPKLGAVWFGGGGSTASTQTVTSQQIPQFEQQFSQENQDIARSIAAQPFPVYPGQQVANLTPDQQSAFNQTDQAATAFQPALNNAGAMTNAAATAFPNANIGAYMNPYVMNALQPQLQQLSNWNDQQNQAINQQASQAGAFGDARQGVMQGLQNFNYGRLQNDAIGQGFSNAFNNASTNFQNDQSRLLNAGNQMANLGAMNQGLGLQGAQALENMGAIQQNQAQNNLNTAYTNFQNQVNWPTEMLNLRTSVLANSPYSQTRINTAPPPSPAAQNLGAFASLAGLAGSTATPFGASTPPNTLGTRY